MGDFRSRLVTAKVLGLLVAVCLAVAIDRYLPPGFGPWRLRIASEIPADGHPASVSALALAPDGERLASGGWDGSLRQWRRSDGFLLARAALPKPAAALHLADDLVWAKTSEGELWRWQAPEGAVVAMGSCEAQRSAAPDGLCAPGGGQEVTVAEALEAHGGPSAAASCRDGTVALGEWTGAVRILSVSGDSLDLLGAPALTVASSRNGRFLASSHGFGLLGEGEIRLFDRRGRLLRRVHHSGGVAGCVAFDPAGQILLARDRQGRFVHWRLPNGDRQEGLPAAVEEACPQPDLRRFGVAIWQQVRGAETLLLDRRTAWAMPLTERYLRVVRRDRSWLDLLLGRVRLFALDLDGNLVLSRAEPRWPTALVGLAAMSLPLAAGALRRRLRD